MRTLKTMILRLYLDSEAPERICGDLMVTPDRKTFHFQDEAGLMTFLHRLVFPLSAADQVEKTTGANAQGDDSLSNGRRSSITNKEYDNEG
jgi:hypothetical protein